MGRTLTSKHLGAIFLAVITYFVADIALHALMGRALVDWSSPIPFIFQLVWCYFFFLSVFLLNWKKLYQPIPMKLPSVGVLVGWVVAMVAISGFFLWAGRYFDMDLPFGFASVFKQSPMPFLMLCLLVVVVAPTLQELLFRGWLWEHLSQSALGPIGALAVTTYLWAIPSATQQIYSGFFNVLMGFVLGQARIWTGSVAVPILMHIAFASFELFLVSRYMWQS